MSGTVGEGNCERDHQLALALYPGGRMILTPFPVFGIYTLPTISKVGAAPRT